MKTILMASAAVFALGATSASAVTLQPTADTGRAGDSAGARGTGDLAYDGNVDTFYELDLGGTIDFTFAPEVFTGPGSIIEVTFGGDAGRLNWDEYVAIEVGFDGAFEAVSPAVLSNSADGALIFTFDGIFDTLRVTDVTLDFVNFDDINKSLGDGDGRILSSFGFTEAGGFDIAEVAVSAVPLPAGFLLLGTALGGFAAVRRRKAKTA